MAQGSVQQRFLIEALAESFRDADPLVRRGVVEALLWDCERRWPWIRGAVHAAFADLRLQHDGPLTVPGGRFSPAAVNDLIAWAMEAGSLGIRATQTLAMHYNHELSAGPLPTRQAAEVTRRVIEWAKQPVAAG